jgi:hypothetical protein
MFFCWFSQNGDHNIYLVFIQYFSTLIIMYHEIKFIFNTTVDLTLDITTKRSKLRLELDLAKIFYNVRFFFICTEIE